MFKRLSITTLFLFFVHSLECTLNLQTQVNNILYKYLRLEEIPVGKTGVPSVKTTAKVRSVLYELNQYVE